MAHTDKHEGHEGKEGSSYPQNQSCRKRVGSGPELQLIVNVSSLLPRYLHSYTLTPGYYNIKDVPNALQPTCCPSHL